jgi:Terminase large subunit, T4likevirus-type, N-terminal
MKIADDLSLALDPALLMEEAGLSPDPWQKQILRSQSRRQLLLTCRQAGKSTVTAVLALHQALYEPTSLVLLLSPSLRQSQELFRKVQALLRSMSCRAEVDVENTFKLELANGSRIIALPGKEETVRGFSGVSLLVVDEAARVSDGLYFSVRPMLAVSNGRLVCLSTPNGKRGFFFDEWESGSSWQRIKLIATECPRITAGFLQEERAALGEHWFRQEYLCEFIETEEQIFGHDLIHSAFSDEVKPLFLSPPE